MFVGVAVDGSRSLCRCMAHYDAPVRLGELPWEQCDWAASVSARLFQSLLDHCLPSAAGTLVAYGCFVRVLVALFAQRGLSTAVCMCLARLQYFGTLF